MIETLRRYGRKIVQFKLYHSTENWHGPNHTVKRSTWQIVRMGSYAKMWTLYRYRADGSYVGYQLTFPFWRGPWPKSAGTEPLRK